MASTQSEIEIVVDASTVAAQEHRSLFIIVAKRSISSVLTRFHAGYFRISLSLGGQTLLWKTLIDPSHGSSPPWRLLQTLPPLGFILLWSLALFTNVLLSLLYISRCFFRFRMVKAEFLHHVGVNYFFAPSISWFLLLQSAPFVAPNTVSYLVLWWVFAVPVLTLDVKIYGQWFTKGKQFLTMVANPTSQLSVIGNLIGARAAAQMGWKEIAVFLFSLGMVHYLVLFVTLYQRLPGGDRLPATLRPVFSLFVAAPSMASLAWESIAGRFDTASKMLLFLSLFLFASLLCRPTLFKKSMRRFSIAWWAFSFPVTILALVATDYAEEVKTVIARGLMLLLTALSVLIFMSLTLLTAFNSRMLLPDDDPIVCLPVHLPITR